MDSFAVAANKIMPVREWFSLRATNIGAGFGQPVHCLEAGWCQPDAALKLAAALSQFTTFHHAFR